jgi:hypothetical protein
LLSSVYDQLKSRTEEAVTTLIFKQEIPSTASQITSCYVPIDRHIQACDERVVGTCCRGIVTPSCFTVYVFQALYNCAIDL